MSKLCPCKKQFIDDLFMDVMLEANKMYRPGLMKLKGICVRKTLEVANIVESDCVCEKKEDSDYYKPASVTERELYRIECVVEEKQSQSPCDHKDLKHGDICGWTYPTGLYMCEECGLVTCLDPNRSGPSKNPNDK